MYTLRVATLLTCLFATSAGYAQRGGPLDAIPNTAAAVLRVQAPETTVEDIASFIDKVQPGFGGMVRAQAASMGNAIRNPSLAGVDQTKDWHAVIFVESGRSPQGVLVIPTTDSAAMTEALGDSVTHIVHGDWVIYSRREAMVAKVQACLDGDVDAISAGMDSKSIAAFEKSHIGLHLNGTALKTAFASELDGANDMLENGLQIMGQQIAQASPNIEMAYIIDMYRQLGTAVIQSVRDSESVTLSLGIVDDALQLDKLVVIGPDTPTDKLLGSQPVSDMTKLNSLPEGLLGYWGIRVDPTSLMDKMMDLTTGMIQDEDAVAKISKMFTTFKDVEFGQMGGGISIATDQEGALQYFAFADVNPSEAMLASFRTIGSGLEYEVAGITQKQTFEEAAEQLDGHDVHVVRLEQSMPAELDPTGMQAKMNEVLYGPEGLTQRVILLDDSMIMTMGGDAESLKPLLTPSTWSDAQLLRTRARLHDQANLMGMFNLPGVIKSGAQLVFSSGAVPPILAPEQLAELEIPPSYIGVSVATAPQQLDARLTIPVETFQGIMQIVMFVQGAMAGGR